MEQKIESYIDNFLGSISSQLYVGGIIFGIVLVIIGIILLVFNTTKKGSKPIGGICLAGGIVSVLSSMLQLF